MFEFLFKKAAGQKACFPVNIAKFLRTAFFNRTLSVVESAGWVFTFKNYPIQ